jgi:hypothetical protein
MIGIEPADHGDRPFTAEGVDPAPPLVKGDVIDVAGIETPAVSS